MFTLNGIRSVLRERGRAALFPLLTAAENVMYPMELRGMKPVAAKKRAAGLIGKVGLPDTVLDRFPAMLSGDEQQRAAIARALGMETKVLPCGRTHR